MAVWLQPDAVGWCWWHQATAIAKYATRQAEVAVCLPGLSDNDAVLAFSWPEGDTALKAGRIVTVLAHHGCQYEFGDTSWPGVAASRIRNKSTAVQKLPQFSAVISVNRQLHTWAIEHGSRSYYLPAGVDDRLFVPEHRTRGHVLRIGWCGQCHPGTPNVKGHDWILRPLMERVSGGVEWSVMTNGLSEARPHHAMQRWFSELDLFLCTSISEGTPATILEALSCGVPVISTSVGDAPEILGGFSDHVHGGMHVGQYHDAQSAEFIIEHLATGIAAFASLSSHEMAAQREAARSIIELRRSWRVLADKWMQVVTGEWGDA